MLVDMKVVYTFNQPDHIKNMRVDVDDIVDGKDNSEEMTREVADIRMYHIRWNFLQLGYDMLWWW